MSDAGPKEIEYVDQQTSNLHKDVAKASTKAGYPVTASDVNAQDHSPLIKIKQVIEDGFGDKMGDAVHVLTTSGTLLGGEESNTFTRTTDDEKVISIAQKRNQMRQLKKKAA